jgi:hypothetical protein
MDYTLRQITDAMWATGPVAENKNERQRIYDRARMLRDRGLILSSAPRAQGRTMTFAEADVAAAVVAITASLNGMSWGIIGAINDHLRAIDNTMGRPEFENHIGRIKAAKPVFARVDIVSEPWAATSGTMGGPEVLGTELANGTTQVLVWPVTALAKPVLDHLAAWDQKDS